MSLFFATFPCPFCDAILSITITSAECRTAPVSHQDALRDGGALLWLAYARGRGHLAAYLDLCLCQPELDEHVFVDVERILPDNISIGTIHDCQRKVL